LILIDEEYHRIMNDLNKKSFGGLIFFISRPGGLLFIPAGNRRLLAGVGFFVRNLVSALLITVYLMKNDPELLERRINAGPGRREGKNGKRLSNHWRRWRLSRCS